MASSDLKGPAWVLAVDPAFADADECLFQPRQPIQAETGAAEILAEQSGEEAIEIGAIPASGHVPLTQGQAASPEQIPVQRGVMNLKIPGTLALQANVRLGEKRTHQGGRRPGPWRCGVEA